MNDVPNHERIPSAPAPRPRRWLWFVAALAVLTVTAIVIQIRYNLGLQLTPEQLARAMALWEKNGPRDYDLEFTQQGVDAGVFVSKVRGGRVVSLTRDGQPLEERLYKYYDVPGLFANVEGFLKEDAKPGQPRTFTSAQFDAADGHLVHYRRSIMGENKRVEITVQLRPLAAAAPETSPPTKPAPSPP